MPDFRKDIDGSAQYFYLKYQVDLWATGENSILAKRQSTPDVKCDPLCRITILQIRFF